MPGAMWYETGPKERSEEGSSRFSAFVIRSPLVQQQRPKPLLPLAPFPSETTRLYWPCQMGHCVETSCEQDGWRLNLTKEQVAVLSW